MEYKFPLKKAEENLRRLFDKVQSESDGKVIFNLDVTAGRRAGYNMFCEYGNVFLENRYTDWGNYYPYQTLRNLWQLSRYVPAERLQVEFLNKYRNVDKYPQDDIFAPSHYSMPYLFATTMAGQPLAWMEATGLPEQSYDRLTELIKGYAGLQHDFHRGIILPVGDEPDGRAWTGFQSIRSDNTGYLLVYREYCQDSVHVLQTWLPSNAVIKMEKVLGEGASESLVDDKGQVAVTIPQENAFVLFRYSIE